MKFPKQAADETGATSSIKIPDADKSLRHRNLLSSLERGIDRRDAEIERLTNAVESEQRVAEALRETIEKSELRISELQQGIEDRMARCRELRDALKVERERADKAEAELHARDNPGAAAKTPRKSEEMLTLEALMDDDTYMRETLVLDDDAEEEIVASTTTSSKTFPWLGNELVDPELIFPAGEEPPEEDDGDHQQTTADAGDTMGIKAIDPDPKSARADRRRSNFKPRFAIVLGGETPIRHPIYKASMTIGRSRGADIQIASDFISRVHTRIITDDEGTYVEDTGSKNGVRVNDAVVEGKQAVNHGDSVRLGRVEFRIVDLSLDDPSS